MLSFKILFRKNFTLLRRGLVTSQNADELVCTVEDSIKEVPEKSVNVCDITPYFPESYNLAAYINTSETLQKLLDLKVNLSKIEKKPEVARKLLKLDFERDIKKHIWFLKDYVEDIGNLLSKNPLILCEDINDIQIRINYLESKLFSNEEIYRIINKNPFWLMFSTIRIDKRLGFYQTNFDLSGKEVRHLAVKQPKIITYNLHHIKTSQFSIKEEMGFSDIEIKQMLLDKPKLWMLDQMNLLRRFNYIHHEMKIEHKIILENPSVLFCRKFIIKQRHLFLQKLGRAQYNPQKENYVPIKALVEDNDVEFCKKYAKCTVIDFNLFLKTL